MNVILSDEFIKSFEKLNNPSLQKKLNQLIDKVEAAAIISDISGLKKLVGFTVHYRIRMGDYRIGVTIIANDVRLMVIAHRKDIYDIFP